MQRTKQAQGSPDERIGRVEKWVLLFCHKMGGTATKREIMDAYFDLSYSDYFGGDRYKGYGMHDRKAPHYDWPTFNKHNSAMVTFTRVKNSLQRKGLITYQQGSYNQAVVSLTAAGKDKASILT